MKKTMSVGELKTVLEGTPKEIYEYELLTGKQEKKKEVNTEIIEVNGMKGIVPKRVN